MNVARVPGLESLRTTLGRQAALLRNRRTVFRHELAIGAIFKDEARFLDEWLTFHHGVGVDHFFLYNDGSTDGSVDVLRPWMRAGLVTLRDWPTHRGQVPAYNDCIRRVRTLTRWLALVDIDEFLFSPAAPDLRTVLREYADLPAIFVYWVLFGSSGHVVRPTGPVVESYTRCLDPATAAHDAFDHRAEPGKANYVTGWAQDGKSIVNPRLVRHYVVHKPGALWQGRLLDENRREPQQRQPGAAMTWSALRINHYWSKSIQDLEEKVRRGSVCDKRRPPRDLKQWLVRERALNISDDTTILPVWRSILSRRHVGSMAA